MLYMIHRNFNTAVLISEEQRREKVRLVILSVLMALMTVIVLMVVTTMIEAHHTVVRREHEKSLSWVKVNRTTRRRLPHELHEVLVHTYSKTNQNFVLMCFTVNPCEYEVLEHTLQHRAELS